MPEKKVYVIDAPIPDEHDPTTRAHYNSWLKHVDDSIETASLMLAIIILALQKDLEHLLAYDIITKLKDLFQHQERMKRFETFGVLHGCKMGE
uniref:Uncharacterized protein n=1 Tax=Lactuca sativa TaxID=4236 RepID=A0A9R1XC22_LACSA|nr:hypothetical protein LSAT_V11C500280070 [Lactuca sativa]